MPASATTVTAASLRSSNRRVVGGLQGFEFGVATDHPGGHSLDAAAGDAEGPRLGAQHQVAVHRGIDALDGQRRLRLDFEHAAHLGVGVVADAQGPGRGGLLHARGDVDGDAADAAVGVDPAAEQHAAGVDAHAHIEAGVAVRGLDFRAEGLAQGQQREAAVHGAFDVVLAGLVRTEGGQDVVAGVLQDTAAVGLHDGGAAGQGVVHHGADGLGVQVLGERGGADHVEEQDADLLEGLGGVGRG